MKNQCDEFKFRHDLTFCAEVTCREHPTSLQKMSRTLSHQHNFHLFQSKRNKAKVKPYAAYDMLRKLVFRYSLRFFCAVTRKDNPHLSE